MKSLRFGTESTFQHNGPAESPLAQRQGAVCRPVRSPWILTRPARSVSTPNHLPAADVMAGYRLSLLFTSLRYGFFGNHGSSAGGSRRLPGVKRMSP